MASINWKKLNSGAFAGMSVHFDNQKRRDCQTHANANIDQMRTDTNYTIGCDGWYDTVRKIDNRRKAVDEILPPKRVRKDRVVGIVFEYPCPEPIRTAGKSDEFFQKTHDFFCSWFGGDNIHGTFVHLDETHEYYDSTTKENRMSLYHAHTFGSPFVPGKGINGDQFETRKAIKALNDAFDEYITKEFGIAYNTHKSPRRKSVEQLKAESAEAEAIVKRDAARAQAEAAFEQARRAEEEAEAAKAKESGYKAKAEAAKKEADEAVQLAEKYKQDVKKEATALEELNSLYEKNEKNGIAISRQIFAQIDRSNELNKLLKLPENAELYPKDAVVKTKHGKSTVTVPLEEWEATRKAAIRLGQYESTLDKINKGLEKLTKLDKGVDQAELEAMKSELSYSKAEIAKLKNQGTFIDGYNHACKKIESVLSLMPQYAKDAYQKAAQEFMSQNRERDRDDYQR